MSRACCQLVVVQSVCDCFLLFLCCVAAYDSILGSRSVIPMSAECVRRANLNLCPTHSKCNLDMSQALLFFLFWMQFGRVAISVVFRFRKRSSALNNRLVVSCQHWCYSVSHVYCNWLIALLVFILKWNLWAFWLILQVPEKLPVSHVFLGSQQSCASFS